MYANRDLRPRATATIGETIPASTSRPERQNKVAVGRDLWLKNPQNQIGHVLSPRPGNLESIYVQGNVLEPEQSTPHFPCLWGAGDDVYGDATGR